LRRSIERLILETMTSSWVLPLLLVLPGMTRAGGGWLAVAVAVGVVTLFLPVGTPSAQEPFVHVNPVIAKLAKGEHVFGVPTSDYSLENARALARAPIDYVTRYTRLRAGGDRAYNPRFQVL
jgi:hypothetical protein